LHAIVGQKVGRFGGFGDGLTEDIFDGVLEAIVCSDGDAVGVNVGCRDGFEDDSVVEGFNDGIEEGCNDGDEDGIEEGFNDGDEEG